MTRRRLAALAVLAAGCRSTATASQDLTAADLPIVPVVAAARADLANALVLTGEFEPFQEVDVMAKIAGYVRTLRVDIGDHVDVGDVLATLEIPELLDELAKVKAEAEAAQSGLEAAGDEERRASASEEIAHLSFGRLSDVLKREPGLVPQQDVDVARTRHLEAEAQLSEAQSKVQASRGRLRVAQAEEARLAALCGYARITAPFKGVITKRYASVGSMIQAGIASQTQAMPVVRVSQNDLLRLVVPIPEAAVPSVRVGQSVEVRVHSLGETLTEKVSRVADEVQMATRTMNIEVDIPNPDFRLVPGMYADVVLRAGESARALAVPLEAVEGLGVRPRVYRVDRDGAIQIVPVEPGVETAREVEILSGLAEGDQVVVGRHSELHAGERVRPKPVRLEGGGLAAAAPRKGG